MKSPLLIYPLVAISLLILAPASCSRAPDNLQSTRRSDLLLHEQTDALSAQIVLTELRDGHLTNALELLEGQIDISVLIINHSLTNLSAPEREGAMGTLRVLKAYREAHPRQPEAVFPDTSKQDAEYMNQASQKASRILTDLK